MKKNKTSTQNRPVISLKELVVTGSIVEDSVIEVQGDARVGYLQHVVIESGGIEYSATGGRSTRRGQYIQLGKRVS